MLIGLDPLLNGEILAVLREMGHGDGLAIVDCNFPAHFLGPPAIRVDGDIVAVGRAVPAAGITTGKVSVNESE